MFVRMGVKQKKRVRVSPMPFVSYFGDEGIVSTQKSLQDVFNEFIEGTDLPGRRLLPCGDAGLFSRVPAPASGLLA